MAASATFALKAGVWFRRGRLDMVSPDSQASACPPSGRNSTYRPVQISGTGSVALHVQALCDQVSPNELRAYFAGERSVACFRLWARKMPELTTRTNLRDASPSSQQCGQRQITSF